MSEQPQESLRDYHDVPFPEGTQPSEQPQRDKRSIILEFHSSPDAILNALHQAGWQVIPKDNEPVYSEQPPSSAKAPCSAKPATQGEGETEDKQAWTPEYVERIFRQYFYPDACKEIARLHTTALAVEKEKSRILGNMTDGFRKEIKQHQLEHDRLQKIIEEDTLRIVELDQQLAAERKLPLYCDIHGSELQRESCNHVRTCEQCLAADRKDNLRLSKQLDAEREQKRELMDQLHTANDRLANLMQTP